MCRSAGLSSVSSERFFSFFLLLLLRESFELSALGAAAERTRGRRRKSKLSRKEKEILSWRCGSVCHCPPVWKSDGQTLEANGDAGGAPVLMVFHKYSRTPTSSNLISRSCSNVRKSLDLVESVRLSFIWTFRTTPDTIWWLSGNAPSRVNVRVSAAEPNQLI